MSTNLLEYLSERYYEQRKPAVKAGPFITISRMTGCGATEVAELLIKLFNKRGLKWKMINKEILDESARKLKFEKQKLSHEFILKRGTFMDEVIKALTMRYYVSDRKIRNTIADVIKFEARKGHVIIIGRAGVVTTADVPRGLHIRLGAPLEWRIETIMKKRNITREEAEKYILTSDKKRVQFLESICERKIGDVCFDMSINRSSFSVEQTAEIILDVMIRKGLL